MYIATRTTAMQTSEWSGRNRGAIAPPKSHGAVRDTRPDAPSRILPHAKRMAAPRIFGPRPAVFPHRID